MIQVNPKGSVNWPGSFAVELILHRSQHFRAGADRARGHRVHVRHLKSEPYRRAAQRFRADDAVIREFVREHNSGIADTDFRVADSVTGPVQAMISVAPNACL